MDIDEKDFGRLCICAIRYCQGRQSYMPGLIRSIVKKHIDDISTNDLIIMINDCKFQEECNLYGDEQIDKPEWLEWRKFLETEYTQRKTMCHAYCVDNGTNGVVR